MRPASQFEIRKRCSAAACTRVQMMNLEARRLGAATGRSDELASMAITAEHGAFHPCGNVPSADRLDLPRLTWTSHLRKRLLLKGGNEQRQCAIEHVRRVRVGDRVSEKILRMPQLIARL